LKQFGLTNRVDKIAEFRKDWFYLSFKNNLKMPNFKRLAALKFV
jgi:hypothetical protein